STLSTANRRCVQRGHGREPACRSGMPSLHQFVEFMLQGAGYRASLTVADDTKVNFAQRNHFRRRAAHKNFVGDIELIARDGFFNYGVAQIARQCDQTVASNALENPGSRGSADDLVADGK